MSRLNAYKALSSPSLIALTSKDPILTAFKLSNQLKSLSKMESQFCKEYTVLREQVQVGLLYYPHFPNYLLSSGDLIGLNLKGSFPFSV